MSLHSLPSPFVAGPWEEEREGAAAPRTHSSLPLFLNLPSMTRGGYATFLYRISHFFVLGMFSEYGMGASIDQEKGFSLAMHPCKFEIRSLSM
jgi:hypothetical protein